MEFAQHLLLLLMQHDTTVDQQKSCPFCHSEDTAFKPKAREWECQACERRFSAGTPTTSARLTDQALEPKLIFFSYGHDYNRDLVDLLREDLEKRGHTVWVDYKEIGAWDDWRGRITQGIHDSQIALAFLSKHSVRDPGVCRNEIAIALHHFGAVYPLLVESLEPQDIPTTVANLQWPDLSQWREIRAGNVAGLDFPRWYQERLLEIVSKIENECSRFANESAILGKVLESTSFDAKFAHYIQGFEGREWVFDAFSRWLDHQPESRVFFLTAGPGFGKTALAVQLANRFRGSVVASWFCDHQSSELKDPRQLLMGLAFQIANRWDDYRVRLLPRLDIHIGASEAVINASRETLRKKSLPDLFRHLFLEPMAGLIWHEHKFVVLIDALDEATESDGVNHLAALIGTYFLELPAWLGFVFTSRVDNAVIQHLQGFKPFELGGDDERNLGDLGRYIDSAIMSLPIFSDVGPDRAILLRGELLQKSCGMVLYLRMISEGLREGRIDIAGLAELEAGVPGLKRRYAQDFSSRFGHVLFERELKPLLRLVVAAPGPLPLDVAAGVLGWSYEETVRVRRLAASYLVDSPLGISLFHKTLADWLIHESSGPWFSDVREGYKFLATYLLELFLPDPEKPGVALRRRLAHEEILKILVVWLPSLIPQTDFWSQEIVVRDLADALDSMARYTDAVRFHERAFELADQLPPNFEPVRALNAYRLGRALARVAHYKESENMLRLSLQIGEMQSRPKTPWIGNALDELAIVLKEQVRFDEAEALFRQALTFRAEHGGDQDPELIVQSHSNLGELLDSRGRFMAAGDVYENAVRILGEMEGPLGEKAVAFLNNFALYQMRLDGALVHGPATPQRLVSPGAASAFLALRNALSACRVAGINKSRPAIPLLLNTLAVGLMGLRSDAAAKAVMVQATSWAESVFGPQHRILATCLNNLATCGVHLADDDLSASFNFARAREIYERTYGAHHPHVARVLNNMGAHAYLAGDALNARAYFQSALEILMATLGKLHCDTTQVLSNLTLLEAQTSGFKAHALTFKEILSIRASILGADHSQTCASRIHYGIAAIHEGDTAQGRVCVEAGLDGLRRCMATSESYIELSARVWEICGDSVDLTQNSMSQDHSGDHSAPIQPLLSMAAEFSESARDALQDAGGADWVSAWSWRDQLVMIDVGFVFRKSGQN